MIFIRSCLTAVGLFQVLPDLLHTQALASAAHAPLGTDATGIRFLRAGDGHDLGSLHSASLRRQYRASFGMPSSVSSRYLNVTVWPFLNCLPSTQ